MKLAKKNNQNSVNALKLAISLEIATSILERSRGVPSGWGSIPRERPFNNLNIL